MNYEYYLAESVAGMAVPAATVPTPMPSRSFGMDILASSRGGVSSHRALSVRINDKRSPTRSGGRHVRVFCRSRTSDAKTPYTKDVSFRIHVRTFEVTPKRSSFVLMGLMHYY